MKIFINTTTWAIVKQENEAPILAGNNYVDQLKVYYDSNPSTQYFYPLLNILKPNDRKVGLISFDATSVEEPNPSTYTDDEGATWYMFKFTLSSDNHQIDVSGKYQFTITTNYYNSTTGVILKQRNINTILSVVNAVTNDDNSVLILGDDPSQVVAELYSLCQSLQTGVASLQISVSALQSGKADLNNPNQDIVAGSITAENAYLEDIISEYGAQITLADVYGISFKPAGSSKYITIGDGKISGVDTVEEANDVTNKYYVDNGLNTKADRNNTGQTIVAGYVKADELQSNTGTSKIELQLGSIEFVATKWDDPTQYKNIIFSFDNGLYNLPTPTRADNPATKNYVDNGLATKGNKIDLEIDSDFKLKAKLYNGTTLLSTSTVIDLPLESVVVSGEYDATNKKVILTLEDGSTIEFSVADLISGLQSEINANNKLSSDLVDDTTSANKFVSQQEKNQITANKNAIEEIEEAIPTKTSDLTNDSGFIDETYHDDTKQDVLSGSELARLDNAIINYSGTDTSTNILAFTNDKGIYIGTDTGHWYYWNGNQYADGGVYQATEIEENSISIDKINFRECLGLSYKPDTEINYTTENQYCYIDGNGTITYNTSLPNFYVYVFPVIANTPYVIKGKVKLGGSYPLCGFKTTPDVLGLNNTPQDIILNANNVLTYYETTFVPSQNGYLFVAYVAGTGYEQSEILKIYSAITTSSINDKLKLLDDIYVPDTNITSGWELGYYRANGTKGYYSNYCNVKFEVVNNSKIEVNGISGVGGSADAVSGILLDENNNVLDVITTQNFYTYYINNVNAKYFAVCNGDINNVSNVKILVVVNSILNVLETQLQSDFSDKVIYTLGDSITYLDNSWAFQLANKIGCKKVYNLARGGATYGNRSYITKYDENCAIWNNDFNYITSDDGKTESYPANTDLTYNNPPSDSSYNQISNQIRFMDRLITEYDRPTPDIIVIACGINDTNSSTPIYDDTDFNNVCNVPYNELTDIQLIRFDYGLRYCIETLMTKYPNAEIMIATPIQTNYGYLRPYLKNTCEWLKAFSVYYSTKLIDTYSECGISAVFEAGHDDMSYVNPNNGRYLYDGLHPNGNGKILMGNYFAKRIFEKHCNIK